MYYHWTLILLFFKYSDEVLLLDIRYNDDLSQGKIDITFYLKQLDMGHKRIKNRYSPCLSQKKCNIVIFYRVCPYLKVHYSEYEKLANYKEPSFKTTRENKTVDTFRYYLNCKSDSKFEILEVSHNFQSNPELWQTFTIPYSKYLHFTFDVGAAKYSYMNSVLDYMSFSNWGFSRHVKMFSNDTYRVIRKAVLLDSYYLLDVKFSTTCAKDYYGDSCWYHCVTNETQTCTCIKKQYYTTAPCTVTCLDGNLPESVSYKIDGGRQIIKRCLKGNPCKNNHCPGECFPLSTSQKICAQITVTLISNKPSSKEIYLEGEIYTVKPNFKKLVPYSKHIYIKIDDLSPIFCGNYTLLEYNYSGKGFTVSGGIYDKEFNFSVIIYLEPWNKSLSFDKKFRIYGHIGEVFISRDKPEDRIKHYVYLGEPVICRSEAKPQYRTMYIWKITGRESTTSFGQNNTITSQLSTNVELKCTCKFFIKKGYPNEKSVTLSAIMRIYGSFGWNEQNNIIHKDINVTCSAKIYVKHKLIIQQMEGIMKLNITNNALVLSDAIGGQYAFYCFLTADSHAYSKIIRFELRTTPKHLCFYIHGKVRGAVVQCGHDGYLKDEYKILVKYYVYAGFYMLLAENPRYVKIPYHVRSPRYKIICEVTSIIDKKKTFTTEYLSGLSSELKSSYNVSDLDARCISYHPYIESPEIINKTGNLYYIKLSVFNIVINEVQVKLILILVICLILSMTPAMLIFVFLLMEDKVSDTALRVSASRMRKRLMRYHISLRLSEEAQKILEMPANDKLAKFYRQSFFQNHFQESI